MAKYVFSGAHPDDGMHWNDRLYIVYMGPMSIAGPHAHTPEQEEFLRQMPMGDLGEKMGAFLNEKGDFVSIKNSEIRNNSSYGIHLPQIRRLFYLLFTILSALFF